MNDIYTILPYLLLGVAWTWGIHCLFQDGFLLSGLLDWLPRWIEKPLYACPPCMGSIHGTIIFFLFIKLGFVWWIVYCVSLCGLNYIIKEYLYAKTI